MKKRKKNNPKKETLSIIVRYLILIIAAFPNLWIFYKIFTPLTIYPVAWILSTFFHISILSGNIIFINHLIPIQLIGACIAGSAYYLLFILNLATPKINLKKRATTILISFLIFLIINIFRIFILTLVAVSGSSLFDITHRLFWYALSTLFVIAIWFWEVKIFRIKEIPFYSDIKNIYSNIK